MNIYDDLAIKNGDFLFAALNNRSLHVFWSIQE